MILADGETWELIDIFQEEFFPYMDELREAVEAVAAHGDIREPSQIDVDDRPAWDARVARLGEDSPSTPVVPKLR